MEIRKLDKRTLRKGKSFDEIFGISQSKLIKWKLSNSRAGKKRKELWPKERIIKRIQELFAEHGPFYKQKLREFSKEKKICNYNLIYQKFGSFENLEKESNIRFLRQKSEYTKNKIIQSIKKHFDGNIIRRCFEYPQPTV